MREWLLSVVWMVIVGVLRGTEIICEDGSCAGNRLTCRESGDCTVECQGVSACEKSIIECPHGPYNCDISCDTQSSCSNAIISWVAIFIHVDASI